MNNCTAVSKEVHDRFSEILENELVLALGCTEPIAIAYAAATARELLGEFPEKMTVNCSGNIIKNVKGVIVPQSGGLKGVKPAAILGAVGGSADLKLEVLSKITDADRETTGKLLNEDFCEVKLIDNVPNLLIVVEMFKGGNHALVEIRDAHTRIVRKEKNGKTVYRDFSCSENVKTEKPAEIYLKMSLKDIFAFCRFGSIERILPVLKQQEKYNSEIAHEGLTHPYGDQVGATLMRHFGKDDVKIQARAMAAAGSDARMSGCVMPVVINSGSGNQGITVTMPILMYAKHLNVTEEIKYRALALSNLVSIYIKRDMGKLSAFCGAVSAASGCGAGITFLSGGTDHQIAGTITNTLANVAGIVCDGAKASCAAKIASAVDAAILAHHMSMDGNVFGSGEGIVHSSIEKTIANTARMGRDGMRDTDTEILNIMLEN
ncbi:MAG: serine dehydratase subunit alpha family protein [Clostridia bacterium]|nr:serine dehydratase subunit alpha family protein [Clostridia bacterium]MBQ5771831.1 serine dehydratase subunit alpha family protein [Clostridia bacterium]